MVLSDLHPTAAALAGAAYFQDVACDAGVVRSYNHLHGDYLRAFQDAQLVTRQCLEPSFGPTRSGTPGARGVVHPRRRRSSVCWPTRSPHLGASSRMTLQAGAKPRFLCREEKRSVSQHVVLLGFVKPGRERAQTTGNL
jgi:hypothetical protein